MRTAPSPATARFEGRSARLGDRLFRGTTAVVAWLTVGLLAAIGALLALDAVPAFQRFGWGFLAGATWDPVAELYGALPFIVGTLATTAIAIVLAAPVGILTAVFLAELAPRRAAVPLTFAIELLAAIPSVVYGLWGVFVLAPFLKTTIEAPIAGALGWIPVFAGPVFGLDLFAAGVILTLMILPTIVSVSRDVIGSVPGAQREAMLALGATRWETISTVVLPVARPGIVGAIILGMGRALGETMAVTMVIGNAQSVPTRLFDHAQTIASQIATTFNEAGLGLQTSALVALGLVLLAITVGMNVIARILVRRVVRPGEAGR